MKFVTLRVLSPFFAGSAIYSILVKKLFLGVQKIFFDLFFPVVIAIFNVFALKLREFALPDFETINALIASFVSFLVVEELYCMEYCGNLAQCKVK